MSEEGSMVYLKNLLGIERRFLRDYEYASVDLAQQKWEDAGQPADRVGLINFLENFMRSCVKEHFTYAAIFLKRKRELQRGDWKPGQQKTAAPCDPTCGGKIPMEWILASDRTIKKRWSKQT